MRYLIKNLKRLLFGLALAPFLMGQQTDTVYTTLGTNITATGVLATKPRAIGQSYHLLTAFALNGGGCATWVGDIRLQGSFDNSVWLDLGISIAEMPLATPKYITAAGSFPFLRANVLANAAGCALDIAYSGNVTGSLTSNTISAVNDNFQYFSVSGNGFGALVDAGTGINCQPRTRLALYGIAITNGAVAAASTSANVRVKNTTTGTYPYTIFLVGLGIGQVLAIPNGPRPIYLGTNSPTDAFDLVFNQGASDSLNIIAIGRCE